MSTTATLSVGERGALLEHTIRTYAARGFRLVNRTDTTAQLLKPKEFSFLLAILGFILGAVPGFIYILYYLSKKDTTVYVEVDEYGNAICTGEKLPWGWIAVALLLTLGTLFFCCMPLALGMIQQ